MPVEDEVARHYTRGSLLERIRTGLAEMGCDPDHPALDDLKPVDEFHIGGVEATRDLLGQLELTEESRILDIGCGICGPARTIAAATGAHVTGIDLTEEFVATANDLNRATGLDSRVSCTVGSALDIPFGEDSFDAATLIHVGMNIPDKARLFAESARVLKPGGTFAVYEVMRVGPGELAYPVPWSDVREGDYSAPPETYREAARTVGFTLAAERERRQMALDFFSAQRAKIAASGGPPPLGMHLVMRGDARQKMVNMLANVEAGRIAPVEMIFRLPA
jgi:SAM-dependent methyltransferase